MKRIVLSIIGGITFPIIFAVLGALISDYLLPQYNFLGTIQVKGQPSVGLIFTPIATPFWIYNYIQFYQFFGFRMFLDTVWFRVLLILGFNFLLYTALTYLLLWYFNLFKQTKAEPSHEPPPPPQF